MDEEEQLKEYIRQLGGQWPFEQSEDEKRMHSELSEVISKHQTTGMLTDYTRTSGTGLRVPGFTNVAGDSLTGADADSNGQSAIASHSMSPGFQSAGTNQGGFQWNDTFTPELKEEDEYNMEV